MYANKAWILLLAIVGLSALFYSAKATYKLYRYYTESTYTVTTGVEWTLEAASRARFIPRAHYTYQISGTNYAGDTELDSRVYRNRWAAEEDLATYTQRTWKVWYNPSAPARSTLQKSFPLKESLSAGLLLAIFGYLIWLGSYVNRTNR